MYMHDLISYLLSTPDACVSDYSPKGDRRTIAFDELGRRATSLANSLSAIGIKSGHTVGIYAGNSIDWLVWDIATVHIGAVLHVFADEDSIVAHQDCIERHDLAMLVLEQSCDDKNYCVGLTENSIESPIRSNAKINIDTDLHSKVYSSGTTGGQKGLLISRTGSEFVINHFIKAFHLACTDKHLIFLPLSNYQQRLSIYACIATGADIVLCPYQRVFQTLKVETPTFLIAPPAFYETVASLDTKNGEMLRVLLGNKIRFLITGMAPLRSKTLMQYWKADLKLLEAYGLTETGMISWNTEDDYSLGSVGKPLEISHLELSEDGELVVARETPLAIGYFQANEKDIKDTFLLNGKIATGDFVEIDRAGFVVIKGRKKDIIVAQNGKKFLPNEIEEEIRKIPFVEDVVVTANRLGSRLVALVFVVQVDQQDFVNTEIKNMNKHLESHMRVSKIIFTDEATTGNTKFLTRNMKLNRSAVYAHFANHIDS